MKPVISFLMTLLLLPFFVACQSYSDNALVDDFHEPSKCPANGCANMQASPTDLSITSIGRATVYSQMADGSIQIGGDCFASTYPANRVIVRVFYGNSQLSVNYASPYADGVAKCNKGRFDITLDVSGLTTGSYRVRLDLTGYDASSVAYNNPASYFEFNLNRF